MRPCYCVVIYVCICVHLTDFLKTNLTKLAVYYMSERSSKGRFLKPDKLQNHSNEGKRKEKKKERGGGKEGKREKAMVALLVFIMATLMISRVQKSG